jgi:hypothetical protein
MLSVKPWPKIATGQPPAGRGTARQEQLEDELVRALRLRLPEQGAGRRDHLRGVLVVGRAELAERDAPTEPGNTLRAGVGRNDAVNAGAVPVWRMNWMPCSARSRTPRARLPPLPIMKFDRRRRRRLIWRGSSQVGADALGREQAQRDDALARPVAPCSPSSSDLR